MHSTECFFCCLVRSGKTLDVLVCEVYANYITKQVMIITYNKDIKKWHANDGKRNYFGAKPWEVIRDIMILKTHTR